MKLELRHPEAGIIEVEQKGNQVVIKRRNSGATVPAFLTLPSVFELLEESDDDND